MSYEIGTVLMNIDGDWWSCRGMHSIAWGDACGDGLQNRHGHHVGEACSQGDPDVSTS